MKESKELYAFLIKAAVMYIIWSLVNAYFIDFPDSYINHNLTLNIAKVSGSVLNLMGFNSEGVSIQRGINLILVDSKPFVRIESGCNGLVLMVLFAGFVAAYPGPVKRKLYFIPIGLFIIYWVNVVRVILLVFNKFYNQSTFDFNHKYTFTLTLYAIIFGMWMLWANKLSKTETVKVA